MWDLGSRLRAGQMLKLRLRLPGGVDVLRILRPSYTSCNQCRVQGLFKGVWILVHELVVFIDRVVAHLQPPLPGISLEFPGVYTHPAP